MSVSVVIAVLVLLTPYSQLPFVMSTRGPLWFCHQVRFSSSYTPADPHANIVPRGNEATDGVLECLP
jgi:hypothetical protein